MLENLLRDLRFSLRGLARRPAATAITLLTIALGIGATTAIFSVVNAVLIRPLPYPEPQALAAVWHTAAPQGDVRELGLSASMYVVYREENRTLEELGVWIAGAASVTGVGEPEELPTISVTAGVLSALGVQPALGRRFSPEDDAPGTPETVVLTHGYWQSRLGGDPSVVGRTIMVDSRPREVIGVLPRGFSFLDLEPELILPLRFDPNALPSPTNFSFRGLARLAPGVTLEQANADIARMLPIWADAYGLDRQLLSSFRVTANVRSLKEDVVGDVGTLLAVLMAVVGAVLLIACANVANLLLVRAEGRRHELAVRAALGAGRLRLAREWLVESVALALLGGALGVALAYLGLRALVALAPANLPRLAEISLDPVVLAFALGVSLCSGLAFGLVPVLSHAAPAVTPLRGGRAGTRTRERRLSQDALAVTQVALALVILVGAGLMLRSFGELWRVEPGFADARHLQLVRVTVPAAQAAARDVVGIQKDMLDRLVAIPGVASAAFASAMPLEQAGLSSNSVWVEGLTAPGEVPPTRRSKYASPGLLAAQGTALLLGRDFTWTDVIEQRPVVIVSERTARETWGDPAAALGKRVAFGDGAPWEEVIGVAADVHDEGLHLPPSATIYRRAGVHAGFGGTELAARTVTFAIRSDRAGTESFLAEIRAAIRDVDADVPVADAQTLADVHVRSMARTSFTLVMLGIAGSMALALGLVGIYGVISYSVSARTREIGIRVAVGARHGDVTGLFLRHAGALVCAGVGIGIAAAAGLARLMSSLLFGVKALDWATYGTVVLALAAACLLASYLPARRALAVDAVQALKAE